MPVPQLADMPPELQGHSIDPAPENDRPLPKVIEGVVGQKDPRIMRDIVGEPPAATIKAQDGLIAMDYGLGNQNTLFHYSDSLVDLSTVNQYPISPTGWLTFTAARGRRLPVHRPAHL
jgi:hypothetical protein